MEIKRKYIVMSTQKRNVTAKKSRGGHSYRQLNSNWRNKNTDSIKTTTDSVTYTNSIKIQKDVKNESVTYTNPIKILKKDIKQSSSINDDFLVKKESVTYTTPIKIIKPKIQKDINNNLDVISLMNRIESYSDVIKILGEIKILYENDEGTCKKILKELIKKKSYPKITMVLLKISLSNDDTEMSHPCLNAICYYYKLYEIGFKCYVYLYTTNWISEENYYKSIYCIYNLAQQDGDKRYEELLNYVHKTLSG
jgi:hypothetical protein